MSIQVDNATILSAFSDSYRGFPPPQKERGPDHENRDSNPEADVVLERQVRYLGIHQTLVSNSQEQVPPRYSRWKKVYK